MSKKPQPHLVRALGLAALFIYGLGDILGAGIYAIIGKVAEQAGTYSWLAFAIAMSVAFLTALSYSELGSRFPRSGGVSVYIQEAFNHKSISTFAGFLLLGATLFSMATLSQAFAGYLSAFGLHLPNWLVISCFFLFLCSINLRGIKQSSITNIISTMVEISGLIIVLICGIWYLSTSGKQPFVPSPEETPNIYNILQGAALAFFAFTGFEDLANVAEEVKNPEKNLPRAILSSLGMAGILYLCVSWIATAIIPGNELGTSHTPLLDVVNKAYPAMPSSLFTIIALFAVANTTLLNYITASRLLYGMSQINLLPKILQSVHRKYHTPYIAILLIFPIVFTLAMIGTLSELAGSTSAIVLTVFSFSSIALIKIKWNERKKSQNNTIFKTLAFTPWLAVGLNIVVISALPLKNILAAAVFVGAMVGISWAWQFAKR